jgi:uncharacterized protein
LRRAASIASLLALLVALPLLAPPSAAAAVTIPPAPQGRISDYAGVLGPADRAALEAQLLRYEHAAAGAPTSGEKAGAPQIAVVVIPSLDGEPVEDVALRFAERWKIGSHADDGILLLNSVAERKLRIEVGYGAEGRLPDALASRIIREIMSPRLHVGDYPGGLRAGVAAIHQALTGQPITGVDRQAGSQPPYSRQGKRWGMGGGVFLLLFLILLLGGRGRGGGGGFLTGMLLGSFLGGRRGGDGGFSGGGGGGGGFSGGGGSFGGGGASGDY